jgi:putative selenate reductase
MSALSAVSPGLAGTRPEVGASTAPQPYGGPGRAPGPAPNRYQIIHLDAYCNECGNCGHFCPWEGRPYTDKPTIFSTAEDFEASENLGWLVADGKVRIRFNGREKTLTLEGGRLLRSGEENGSEERFHRLFEALYASRPHLFGPVEPTSRKPAGAAKG